MKKIIISFLILLLGFGQVLSKSGVDVDLLYKNIENKVSTYNIENQFNIYQILKTKIFFMKLKNKDSDNYSSINELFDRISVKTFHLENILMDKGLYCPDYDCMKNNIENKIDTKGYIDFPPNVLFRSGHGIHKINITYDNVYIYYKNKILFNSISDTNVLNISKVFYSDDLTDNQILSESIDRLNDVIGYTQECKINVDDNEKLLKIFDNWKIGNISSNDLDFGICNTYRDDTIKSVINKYKEKETENNNKKIDILKTKYQSILNDIEVKFINLKDTYDVGENISAEIEILNVPDDMVVIVSNKEGDNYIAPSKHKLNLLEKGGYDSSKNYYDNEGDITVFIDVFDNDFYINNKQMFRFDYSDARLQSLKNFSKSFQVIDNLDTDYFKGFLLDNSYIKIENDLYKKDEKIYYLNRSSGYIELEGLEQGQYNFFSNLIYTGKFIYNKRFSDYENKVIFESDYDTFSHICGEYYKDKNGIYKIDNFYNKVTEINNGKVYEIKILCED